MRGFVGGVLVGFLLCAALVGAGTKDERVKNPALRSWDGEGARTGLYIDVSWTPMKEGTYTFYECRRIGAGKVTAPAPSSR